MGTQTKWNNCVHDPWNNGHWCESVVKGRKKMYTFNVFKQDTYKEEMEKRIGGDQILLSEKGGENWVSPLSLFVCLFVCFFLGFFMNNEKEINTAFLDGS